MQKYKYICLICLFLITAVFANDQRVLKLYQQNNLTEIRKLLKSGKIVDSDWKDFAETLFLEDGETALSAFVSIHDKTGDRQLKNIIVDRLSQYYYAKGLYNSANRVIDDPHFRRQIFASNTKKILFGVQVGAFASRENATKARRRYEKLSKNIFIVPKAKKGKKLYTVVVGKYSNREAARTMKREIARKLKQTGMIIQY